MNYTFSIIKPDAYEYREDIKAKILLSGFNIIHTEEVLMDDDQARIFYSIHREKPFFSDLIKFMTSGPIVLMVIGSDSNTVKLFRTLIGDTDPKKADDRTIRNQYGSDVSRNAIHGADSNSNAKKEILFFFPNLSRLFNKKSFIGYREFLVEFKRIDESTIDKVKSIFKRGTDFGKEVWMATKRESRETKEALRILRSVIRGEDVTSEEKNFLKLQSLDLIKVLPLIAIQGIPIPIPITPILILAGKKIKINILPDSHTKSNHTY